MGDQLDAPAYGADGAEDVGGGGDGGLGRHGFEFWVCGEGTGERGCLFWVLFVRATMCLVTDFGDLIWMTLGFLGIVDVIWLSKFEKVKFSRGTGQPCGVMKELGK